MISGNLRKMHTQLGTEVEYSLPVGDELIPLNEYLGEEITLRYNGTINCVKCGRKTNKSFSQGFCYPCFTTAPETEECVLRPELCRAHEGLARDMEYAEQHCLKDQYVYLSLTNAIKVGVTRHTQIPTRWIDQGATMAIKLAKTPNRYTAGLIEVALKSFLPDKTNWRNMLTGKITDMRSITEVKEWAIKQLPEALQQYADKDNEITKIQFPVDEYPEKVKSLNFDKTPEISGTLTGIKGQYLMLDNEYVLNIRKFGGYFVEVVV